MSSPDPHVRAARNAEPDHAQAACAGPSSRSPAPPPASARCSPQRLAAVRRDQAGRRHRRAARRVPRRDRGTSWTYATRPSPRSCAARTSSCTWRSTSTWRPTPRPAPRTTCAARRPCSPPPRPPGSTGSCCAPPRWSTGRCPTTTCPLAEDAELRATAEATGVGDLLEIERLGAPRAARAPRPQRDGRAARRPGRRHGHRADPVLRVAAAAGGGRHPGPPGSSATSRTWCSALEYAVLEKVDGELAVGCDGWLEQEEVEELSGIRRMELPSAVALGAASRLHRLGLTPSPAGDLAYTMHPWVVSGSRLHDAGWRPAVDQRGGARRAPGGGRRAGTPSPAAGSAARTPPPLGAAGATVALLGTAALVRRARKARRRI